MNDEPTEPDPGPSRGITQRARGIVGGWLFGGVWIGVCASAADGMLGADASLFSRAMWVLFLLVGVAILVHAAWQTVLARRHADTVLRLSPAAPRGGESFDAEIRLRSAPAGPVTLRLADHRIDDSGSTTRSRIAWQAQGRAAQRATADGGARFVARFTLPVDAAPAGVRRDGEQVSWRIELLGAGDRPEVAFDVPVRPSSDRPDEDGVDRWAPRAVEPPPSGGRGEAMAAMPARSAADAGAAPAGTGLPAPVRVHESPQGVEMVFARQWPIVVAVMALLAAATVAGITWREAVIGESAPRDRLHGWGIAVALLAVAMHAGTLRWRVRVGDDGAIVARGSWLWPRWQGFSPAAVERCMTELSHTVSTSGRPAVEYHRLVADAGDGKKRRLTPALAGEDAARAVALRLRRALADRRPRFAPGTGRQTHADLARRARQAMLVAWLAWALAAGALAWALLRV